MLLIDNIIFFLVYKTSLFRNNVSQKYQRAPYWPHSLSELTLTNGKHCFRNEQLPKPSRHDDGLVVGRENFTYVSNCR